jgi:subtilisin family serine protease
MARSSAGSPADVPAMDPALWELIRRHGGTGAEVEAIARLDSPAATVPGLRRVSRFGSVATCRLSVDDIVSVRANSHVLSLKAARAFHAERPSVTARAQGSETSRGTAPAATFTGAGVVIGILDGGCDFDHPDFKNADGTTRLLALWDQSGASGPHSPRPYGYGRVHNARAINQALAARSPYRALGYHPDRLAPGPFRPSHGTHVMGIAAGNGRSGGPVGAAPDAALVFVQLDSRLGALNTMGDSVRILEAVDFVARVAHRAGNRPWVINISQGRHGGPHDGTTLVEQAFDQVLAARSGRMIVQSAGNYYRANVHASGRVAPGATRSLVMDIGAGDQTVNELEVWYGCGDEFTVRVRSPAGAESGWVGLGHSVPIREGGNQVGMLYHRRDDPNNHDHHVDLFLDPAASSGRWTVELRAHLVRSGVFHAWIERDPGVQTRFIDAHADPSYTIGTIANSRVPLIAGSYAPGPAPRLAGRSSSGPTRDGRTKPDLLAPGVGILAAASPPKNSGASAGGLTYKSGTSMAAPRVAGAVAWCMQAGIRDAATIRKLLLRTATPFSDGPRTRRTGCGTLDSGRLIRALEDVQSSHVGRSAPRRPPNDSIEEAATPVTTTGLHMRFVDETGTSLGDGEYAVHQGGRTQRGTLTSGGTVIVRGFDRSRPFVVEIRDRACAIADGAYLDPDDPKLEYGGVWFDWTAVRDGREANFWPTYRASLRRRSTGRAVDQFWQHEHVVRRPIRAARGAGGPQRPVVISATPTSIRTGPIVRYTDASRLTVWLETMTPAMVRLRLKRAGGREAERMAYASTVRCGGRYFAIVEAGELEAETWYQYTLELVPPPGTGPVPTDAGDFADFPACSEQVRRAQRAQLASASVEATEWLSVRTLSPHYKRLRFLTGSCRWYPGDVIGGHGNQPGRAWGPDMLDRLGEWLRKTPRTDWPAFQFYGGDQIYADEIGDRQHQQLVRARFASRLPGPADPAAAVADRLIDGAWSGRFAHRLAPAKARNSDFRRRVDEGLRRIDVLLREQPLLNAVVAGTVTEAELNRSYRTVTVRRQLSGAKSNAVDERKLRVALDSLPRVRALQATAEPFRVYRPYWAAAPELARQLPDASRYRSCNFLLWTIPVEPESLPTVQDQRANEVGLRGKGGVAHRSADGGRHAADFAEYSFLYEWAWTTPSAQAGQTAPGMFVQSSSGWPRSSNVRTLLANVPTFLMFDDHEVTDDWNADATWVRMLHSSRDFYRMWPKTITDALCAYFMYQGWGNKASSQWGEDRRVTVLRRHQAAGTDALPDLRRCIHDAVMARPPADPNTPVQTGLALDWHYRLPFDPPFLVADCRSRKRLDPADERMVAIDQRTRPPQSQTIDSRQIEWMRTELEATRCAVAFVAPSSPLLMQQQLMNIMTGPRAYARAWAGDRDPAALVAAFLDAPSVGGASDRLVRLFRRSKDLEHMIRDRSWRDIWRLVETLHRGRRSIRTLVLVSGDVHHSYCMTGNISGKGRPTPEVVQITSSGLQTTIRSDAQTEIAGAKSNRAFSFAGRYLRPGFVVEAGTRRPEVALYRNAGALVDVRLGVDVDIRVAHLVGADGKLESHVYRYTSGAGYLHPDGEPVISPWHAGQLTIKDEDSASQQPAQAAADAEVDGDGRGRLVGDPLGQRFHDLLWRPLRADDTAGIAARKAQVLRFVDELAPLEASAFLARITAGGDLATDLDTRLSSRLAAHIRELVTQRIRHAGDLTSAGAAGGTVSTAPAELARGIRTASIQATTASGSASTASPAPTPRRPVSPGTPSLTGETQLGTLLLEAQGWPRFSYRFTPADALWTAKLLELEAGGRDDLDNAAVLWAMLNRYAFFTHRVRAYPTFTAYLRAYSTTLQPVLVNKQAAARHVHSPEFVRTGGYYDGTKIPKGQLRRHLDVQAQPWSALDATTRAFTLRALRGSVPNPGIGNASEFASTRMYWKQRNKTRREPTNDEWRRFTEAHGSRRTPPWRWIGEVPGLNQRKNAFFLDLRVARLPSDAVRILPP